MVELVYNRRDPDALLVQILDRVLRESIDYQVEEVPHDRAICILTIANGVSSELKSMIESWIANQKRSDVYAKVLESRDQWAREHLV